MVRVRGTLRKVWNQIIILLFTQDMLNGEIKCFWVTGYFDALKHDISCGITLCRWRWNHKIFCRSSGWIPHSDGYMQCSYNWKPTVYTHKSMKNQCNTWIGISALYWRVKCVAKYLPFLTLKTKRKKERNTRDNKLKQACKLHLSPSHFFSHSCLPSKLGVGIIFPLLV